MSSPRLWHLFACFITASIVTFGAVALDGQRTSVQLSQTGLLWARQVASQAEGMSLRAKESGEQSPVDWAVNYLSQGVEPRLVRISRAHAADAQNTETWSLDRDAGVFDYTRIFTPEDGAGVHVLLTLGYFGFWGARSPFTNDLMTTILFGLCFAIAFLKTGRHFGFDDTSRLRELVSRWVGGAKTQLTRHGSHVREMVRQSQRLAACAGKAREFVGELREKIHEGLNELHESREFYREGETIAARAETLALNMAIEANRLGGDARRIADMATELHRRIQAMHAVNRKGQSLIQRIELKVEPWTTDADLAYHAFDDVREATQLLGQHIRSTTESLVGQAKLIQGLNQELGVRPSDPALPRREEAPVEPALTSQAAVQAPAQPAPAAPAIAGPAESPGTRLPDPLPPIEEHEPKPLFRKLRIKKSA